MAKRYKTSLIILLVLILTEVSAQNTILTTGANATGNGGSVSYSVGQIVYTSEIGITGSLTQGVQQSYDISIVNGIENAKINLEISAFPNPTTSNLILTINDIEFSNMTFQLFDVTGKLLQEKIIIDNQTIVDMNYYSPGIYFVKIQNESIEFKNFKIIKH